MTLAQVPNVQVRADVLAADYNRLADAVRQLQAIVSQPDQSQADALGGIWLRGLVTAVYPSSAPTTPTSPDSITYDIQPLGMDDSSLLTGVKPDVGRIFEAGSSVLALGAAVGTKCLICRFPDGSGAFANFVVLQEPVRFKTDCST